MLTIKISFNKKNEERMASSILIPDINCKHNGLWHCTHTFQNTEKSDTKHKEYIKWMHLTCTDAPHFVMYLPYKTQK